VRRQLLRTGLDFGEGLMKPIGRLTCALFGATLLVPLVPALAGPAQEKKDAPPAKQELPPGVGKDLLIKDCSGCHELTVVTAQHKSESKWTDTIVEMRNRGADGSDEDMEQIVHYLTANFGPQDASARVNINSAGASDIVSSLSLSQADADAIVAYRTRNGKYKDLAGLKQVPGVDAAKIDAVKDRIDF
jgi:competence protein ComEA